MSTTSKYDDVAKNLTAKQDTDRHLADWEVLLQGDEDLWNSRETFEVGVDDMAGDEDMDDEECAIAAERTCFELSIIRASYVHGHKSWGWNGRDKIILNLDGVLLSSRERRALKAAAQAFADKLNQSERAANRKRQSCLKARQGEGHGSQ